MFLLVNLVHFRYDSYADNDAVDGFFAEAAAAVLDKMVSGTFNAKAMMGAILYSVDQGSIHVSGPHLYCG